MKDLNWLDEGMRVVATTTIMDVEAQATEPTAEPGDYGTVEHAEDGWLPVVRFDRTGYAYGVNDTQVRPITDDIKNKVIEAVVILQKAASMLGSEIRLQVNDSDVTVFGADGFRYGYSFTERDNELSVTMVGVRVAQALVGER